MRRRIKRSAAPRKRAAASSAKRLRKLMTTPAPWEQGRRGYYKPVGRHIEAIDVVEDWDLNFNLGNVLKYIARAERKGSALPDLEKAAWYMNREVSRHTIKK